MKPSHTIHRLARVLAGLAGAAAAYAIVACAALPAALATTTPGPARPAPDGFPPVQLPLLPPGWNKHPPLPGPAHVNAAFAGGLTGGQITLVTAAAALLATVVAVTIHRVRAARQRATAATA